MGIGNLIKALRNEKNMTVKTLSEGICSERFLYMVENNDRVPSAELIRRFGQKLKLDIFDYFEFMSFSEPIQSKKYIDESGKLRKRRLYEKLEALTDYIEQKEDAKLEPLYFDIVSNRIFLLLFYYKNYEASYSQITGLINRLGEGGIENILSNKHYCNDSYFYSAINYLMIYHRLKNDERNATRILDYLMNGIITKAINGNLKAMFISIQINCLFEYVFLYKRRDLLMYLHNLLDYQIRSNQLDRLYFTYYLFSGHYYNLKDIENANRYFALMVASGTSSGDDIQFKELIASLDSEFLNTVCPSRKIVIDI